MRAKSSRLKGEMAIYLTILNEKTLIIINYVNNRLKLIIQEYLIKRKIINTA